VDIYIRMELLEGIDQSELMGMAGLLVDLTPSNGEQRRAVSFCRIPVGSHVAVFSNTIYHHGIFIGEGKVIHFTGTDKTNSVITESTDEEFIGENTTFFLINYENDNPDRLALTVKVAKFIEQRLHNQNGMYHAFSCNCESFAVFCRTGSLRLDHPIDYQHRTFPPSKIKNISSPSFWTGLSRAKK